MAKNNIWFLSSPSLKALIFKLDFFDTRCFSKKTLTRVILLLQNISVKRPALQAFIHVPRKCIMTLPRNANLGSHFFVSVFVKEKKFPFLYEFLNISLTYQEGPLFPSARIYAS